MSTMITLDGNSLTRAQLVEVANGAAVDLDPAALRKVERAAQFLAAQVAREEPIYGVSTGFGSNADKLLGAHPLRDELPGAVRSGRSLHVELQGNLIVTHAVCVSRSRRRWCGRCCASASTPCCAGIPGSACRRSKRWRRCSMPASCR